MKNYNFVLVFLIITFVIFSSFNCQDFSLNIEGLFKLVQINDNNLPSNSEKGSERITLSGIILFSQDGMWSSLFYEKESEDSPASYGMLKGKFKIENKTIILDDEILDDTYFGKLKDNEILIISDDYNNTYRFNKVDMAEL
jgi:hypothetical protein